jgi:hypothetical protein
MQRHRLSDLDAALRSGRFRHALIRSTMTSSAWGCRVIAQLLAMRIKSIVTRGNSGRLGA